MTTMRFPAGVLEQAGLPASEVADWAAAAPQPGTGPLQSAAAAASAFLTRGQGLAARLPEPARAAPQERAARQAITGIMNGARDTFLRSHAAGLYDQLTGHCTKALRVEQLVCDAAAAVPGLTPTRREMAAERERMLADKEGIEFAQGLLVAHVLALPHAGRHLVGAMLRPVPAAFERLAELRAVGAADLGPARVTRLGRAAVLEMTNPRHLNAEDDLTLDATEAAVDMILLDPDIEVGVIRGGVVEHPRYPGTRVFGSGINLTRLYHGRIDFLFYLVRDLGYVNKIYRGITLSGEDAEAAARYTDGQSPGHPERDAIEKLWVAAVERYAVGGACQLLHVVDHVIATRGARLFLPARKEGIIPGVSNLRLPRFVGDRAARQAIFSGREWTAGEPDADLLCDEVVQAGEMDGALDARVAALTDSGLVNAAANRSALRAGQEPLDAFREYMATFSVEQARCHLSPALVRNLELHWNARERSL
jgi:(3,5-dihydroxyphenyl)acetyl-CoA 1,2-dioxygenase